MKSVHVIDYTSVEWHLTTLIVKEGIIKNLIFWRMCYYVKKNWLLNKLLYVDLCHYAKCRIRVYLDTAIWRFQHHFQARCAKGITRLNFIACIVTNIDAKCRTRSKFTISPGTNQFRLCINKAINQTFCRTHRCCVLRH